MPDNERIITVQRTAKHFFRTRKIWQYDVGHVLRFNDFDLPEVFQVHFGRSVTGESTTQIGTDGACALPDMYAQNSGVVYAWVYVADAVTGLTKELIEIPVEARGAITNQEPTPVQQSTIDQAIAALNKAVEDTQTAQQAAEDAAESVKNASATAETLSPGSPATVVVRDVEGVKTFEFGIPEGRKGETGETPNFTVGSVTTLPAGSPVTVTITGTDENPVLNIGIPQGAQGDKGDTGAVPHFTIGTVTTLPPNSPATVTITGTDENPILNLGIPKGVQGQKGDKGDAFTYADFTEAQKLELIQGPIQTAQSAAVTAVQNAGAAQVRSVENKGQEVRDSIPSDYSALSDDVNSLKSAFNESIDRIERNIGAYNYFDNTNVSLIDVTGSGAYRAGFDCGVLPVGDYKLSFDRKSDSSTQIILTTVKNGIYTQSNNITSPHSFSADGETDVIVRSNAQALTGWAFYNVTLLNANSIVVKDEINNITNAFNGQEEILKLAQYTEINAPSGGSGYIDYSTGNVTAHSSIYHTDYIGLSVFNTIKYRIMHTSQNVYASKIGIAFYDASKVYLCGFNALAGQTNGYGEEVINVPNGAMYARFSYWNDTGTYGDFYVYGASILYDTTDVIANFINNKNLFDKTGVTSGKYINANNGSLVDYSGSFVSDFIEVKRGSTYTYHVAASLYGTTAARRLALFDESYNYLLYTSGTLDGNVVTVTIPKATYAYGEAGGIPKYCRFTDYIDQLDSTMFVEGSEYPQKYYAYGADYLPNSYRLNETQVEEVKNITSTGYLYGKKIAYNGDSIAESRLQSTSANNGGGYAKLIADATGGTYANSAVSGGVLASAVPSGTMPHSVVNTLSTMPDNADMICFEGGINDYWRDVPLGDYTESDYSGTLDTTTVCGALESIFRQATTKWVGKPIVFVIVHKIKSTVYVANTAGYTFAQAREKMIGICNKYAIPYYDAFAESGLNAYNDIQNTTFLTSNSTGNPDGCHPNEAAYRRYYVPQLIALFESVVPRLAD